MRILSKVAMPLLSESGIFYSAARISWSKQTEAPMSRSEFVVAVAMVLLVPGLAASQSYPSRPLRLIVPSAPGGSPDINARELANELTKQMGQQVVVENRAGASGILGYEELV